jgi:2-phosphosulfolactate phosphatase
VVDPGRHTAFRQSNAGVRFEWGLVGATVLAPDAACLVVVDVLSFTTSVTVAVSRGMSVFPHRWDDESARAFAAGHDAKLAVRRRDVSAEHPWSLSPAVLSTAPVTPRLVLPSPNGSTVAAAGVDVGVTVVAASLRNGTAVGRWLVAQGYGTSTRPLAIVAAGEKWPDGSLRPALEDALGAGAVLHHLRSAGCLLSAEADAVASMFGATADVIGAVRSCGSARRLVEAGYGADVDVAAALEHDEVVPVLRDGAFSRVAEQEPGSD